MNNDGSRDMVFETTAACSHSTHGRCLFDSVKLLGGHNLFVKASTHPDLQYTYKHFLEL